MSKANKKILLFLVVFGFSFNIILPKEGLDYYKKLDRELTKFISHLEERVAYLQKEIEYWEYQLTGFRRFFYPRELGIRQIVERWISDDKAKLAKTREILEEMKVKRQWAQDKILEIETGSVGIFDIDGSWESTYKPNGIMAVYNITQTEAAFSWTITHPDISGEDTQNGIIQGNKLTIEFKREKGPHSTGKNWVSVTGEIKESETRKGILTATKIKWENGIIFTRKEK